MKLLSLTENKDKSATENGVDIIQMLAKAQNHYVKSINESEKTNAETPKQIGHWPIDYNINSNVYIKPEPIRLTGHTAEAQNSQEVSPNKPSENPKTQLNPIIQRLLTFPNEMANEAIPNGNTSTAITTSEMLSLDLKRKLNILNGSDTASMSSSSNPNPPPATNGIDKAKNLITVKDFEENLLNESSQQNINSLLKSSTSASMGAAITNKPVDEQNKKQTNMGHMFYLDSAYGQQRQNQLSLNDFGELGNNILTPLSSNERKYYKQFSSNVS
jgi:hypothetical protein